MRLRSRCLLLALAFVGVTSSLARAQGSFTSTLSGTVVDPSGAVIPGADVKARNNGTGDEYNTVTATNGTFSIPALFPGSYRVTVALMGFKTVTLNEVTVNAATPASVRVILQVGALEENVTVIGDSGLVVQTQTPAVATTMSATQIVNLPLTSRNALDSLISLPGFNTSGTARDSTISGMPKSAINITLDGMSIQDNYLKTSDGFFARLQPSLDAVEEVTVTTAANTADVNGQGGAQIKFVTRSGSNSLTGSVYEYYRNDKLNANTWFNNAQLPPDPATGKAPKAQLLRYQPGFRVGGPIKHDKAFFFVNYEQQRQPSNLTQNRIVLTPSALNGVFSYNANGQTRQVNLLQLAAANAQIATLDPTVAKVSSDIQSAMKTQGSLIDLSNPLVQQYNFQVPTSSINHFPTLRLDYNAAQNHRVTGSFNYNHINSTPDTTNNRQASFPGFPATGSQQSTRWTTSEGVRSTIGQNVVNEFRIGATGGATFFSPELNPSLWTNQGGYHLNFASACCGGTNALHNIDTFGNSFPTNAANNASATYQAREASTKIVDDTLTWIKGSHSLAFGTTFTQGDLFIDNQQIVPTVNFGLVTGDPAIQMFNATNFPGASTQDIANARGLYSILTGHVTSVLGDARLTPSGDQYVYLGVGRAEARLREFDFFTADSWRARPNLTINYGLRYALQFPFYPKNKSYTTATLDSLWGVSGVNNIFKPGTLTGLMPTFVQFPQGTYAYHTDKNNFAPSVGAAWSAPAASGLLAKVFGKEEGDSVFRGGFAVAYERPGMSNFTDVYGSNPGLRITGVTDRTDPNGNIAVGALLRNPSQISTPAFSTTPVYPIVPSIGNSVNIFDSNLQIPYAQSWTAGWQRKVGRNAVIEARWVGSRHRNDWVKNNINEIDIVENGFLSEFRKAQANLQANIAANRGNTFAYTGAPGTSPLPTILAYFSGVSAAQAGDPSKYTSTSFTDSTFVNTLAVNNPQPCCSTSATTPSFAYSLISNAGRRTNALTAGLPSNFFVANPNLLGSNTDLGANYYTNGSGTRYNSAQFEYRQRLGGGARIEVNYVFGRAYQLNRYGFRQPEQEVLQSGTVGGVTHALKGDVVFELPFGREHRWANTLGPVMDRLVGGWQVSGIGRVQTGELLDFGNVRLVGMSADEFRQSLGLRFGSGGSVYILSQDIIDNTVKAFNVNATSPTGYGALGPPTGRYLAPANGPDCVEVSPGYGTCGVRSLVVTGPRLVRFDLSVVKRVQLRGRANAEFRVEMLNAFNSPYFEPVIGLTTSRPSQYEGNDSIPLANAVTTSSNDFKSTRLLGDNQSRIIQLVWRFSW